MMNQPELTIKANHLNEYFIYDVNRNTFDQKSSKDVFEHHFNDKLLQKDTLFIFSGSDSGLLIDYLLTQELPDTSQYLFVELDYIESHIDKTKLINHKQIQLTTSKNWAEKLNNINIDAYLHTNALRHIKSLAALNLHDINYHTLNLELAEKIQHSLFTTAAQLNSHKFIKQQLSNVSENMTTCDFIRNKFKELPCIVLAAGPSLDKHVNWIKSNRNKFVILAVSRISAKLISEDITPDIIFTIDPQDISFTVSREMFLFKEPPILINSYHASNLIISQWHGKQFYLDNLLPWESHLNKNNIASPGPTVTNTALHVAIEMGFDKIYLIGVDLCFSQTGISHSSGSIESKFKNNTLAKINEVVETYDNRQAETTIQYKLAAYSLNEQANYAISKGSKVYNLSSSAIKLSNINYIEAKNIEIENDILSKKMSIFHNSDSDKKDITHLLDLKKEFIKIIKQVKEVKLLADSAITHNNKLFKDKGEESANFTHKIKMDKIEKKLNNKYKVASDFLKKTGLQFFTKCITVRESHQWSDELIQETGQLYYQAYIESYNNIMPVLDSNYKRILNRIDEFSSMPKLNPIIKQWLADKQFNRINVIKNKNINLHNLIKTQTPVECEQLIKLSEDQLTEVTNYEKSLEKNSNIEGIREKIILRFKQKNINSLTQIKNHLHELKAESGVTHEISSAYFTVTAYLAFINQEYLATLTAFEQVPKEQLSEDEYILIAQCAIKLESTDLAESSLSKLSQHNLNYLPQLAQIQKINGNNQQAIESYSDYLSQRPNDIYQWLSLSKLLMSLKQYGAATETLECILKQDPKNETALSYLSTINAI